MHMGFLPACSLCITCMPGSLRGQISMLEFLELELMVMITIWLMTIEFGSFGTAASAHNQ